MTTRAPTTLRLEAVAIAEHFGDGDLLALALHEQGYALVAVGRLDEGLGLVDEAMLAVCAGELSPIVTGLVYCSAIDRCRDNFELRRAQEWTAALTRWCDAQPGLVAFTGRCLVHRSELLQLHGAWDEALTEARRAGRRAQRGRERRRGRRGGLPGGGAVPPARRVRRRRARVPGGGRRGARAAARVRAAAAGAGPPSGRAHGDRPRAGGDRRAAVPRAAAARRGRDRPRRRRRPRGPERVRRARDDCRRPPPRPARRPVADARGAVALAEDDPASAGRGVARRSGALARVGCTL